VTALYHSYTLPWSFIVEEVGRLKRYVIVSFAFVVVMGIIIPFIPVPKPDIDKAEPIPERYAQLMVEQQKKPPPPPPKKVVKKKEKKKVKKKEKKKEKKKVVKKKPKPKKPEKTEAQKQAEARKKAASSGLLAFADELADLRDKPVTKKLNKSTKLSQSGAKAQEFKRDILTSNTVSTSGGINTSTLSTGVGRSASLSGRETQKVESGIDKVAAASKIERGSRSSNPKRSEEEITRIFDKNKGAIFRLYNRALRKDPTLEGKIVFELVISPAGQVLSVKIISSELNSPALEKKLAARIKLFNFGSKNVEELVVTYPVDFLPS